MAKLDCKGHAAFYAMIILPIAISCAAVAIDVSGWNAVRDEFQKDADDLALAAANFLPDHAGALRYVREAKLSGRDGFLNVDAFIPGSASLSIAVRISGKYQPTFSKLIPGTGELFYRVERQAIARRVAGDYVFILADSSTLRPPLAAYLGSGALENQQPWGDASSWPASGYFNCATAPESTPSASLSDATRDWHRDWSDESFRRRATAACFNPILSAEKLGAIAAIDTISAASEDRVGLIFTPGSTDAPGYSVLKALRDEPSQLAWPSPNEEPLLGDESCMLFSNPESSFSDRYELPPSFFAPASRLSDACAAPLAQSPCGEPHRAVGHLSNCYLQNFVTLRHAVYWHAAQPLTTTASPTIAAAPPRVPQVATSLRAAMGQFVSDRRAPDSLKLRQLRGTLADDALRKVILVSDFLPSLGDASSGLAQILAELRSQQISVVIIGYNHPGLSEGQRSILLERVRELSHFEQGAGGSLRTALANSPEDLQFRILPRVLLLDQQIALQR